MEHVVRNAAIFSEVDTRKWNIVDGWCNKSSQQNYIYNLRVISLNKDSFGFNGSMYKELFYEYSTINDDTDGTRWYFF